MSVDTSQFQSVADRINRKYEHALMKGSEQLDIKRISTGSPELDVAMGRGVPLGRFTRFYGGFGSTKTMTALSCIAEAQRQGLLCVLFDVEKRFTKDFAERLGVDTTQLRIVRETSIEAVGEIWEALLGVANFFVVDSCSVAVSEDELNCDIRDWRPGINARAWGKTFRRVNERWDENGNTAVIIDQMRVNFRTGEENPAGGRIFDHQSSMSVKFVAGKWLYRDEDGILDPNAARNKGQDEQTVPAGREIKIRIEKSSVSRPFRTATLRYDLDTLEYDRLYEYTKAARYYGLVKTTSKGRYEYVDDEGNVTRIHGESRLRKFLADNPGIQEYIHNESLAFADQDDAMREIEAAAA